MDAQDPGHVADPTPSEAVATDRTPPPATDPRAPRKLSIPPSQARRATYAVLGVILVLAIGTVGFRLIAGTGWVDSFYFESMLATGQGPPFALTSNAAKLFASAMAFISVASVVSAIFFTLGPILIAVWRETVDYVEAEARRLEHDVRKLERRR